jgi:hypothetical protein
MQHAHFKLHQQSTLQLVVQHNSDTLLSAVCVDSLMPVMLAKDREALMMTQTSWNHDWVHIMLPPCSDQLTSPPSYHHHHHHVGVLLQLTGVLKLLLHPRRSIFAHMPFAFGPSCSGSSGSRPDLSALPPWQQDGGGVGSPVGVFEVVCRMMPIWLTVVLLLVTHTPALKLQDMLRR